MLTRTFCLVRQLLWPARCAGCDGFVRDGTVFCDRCAESLMDVTTDRPALFDDVYATFAYGGAIKDAILRLKHGGRHDLAGPLGRLLASSLTAAAVGADAIVPVPLHPARLRRRGFNQALELARGAWRPGLPPIWVDPLRRARNTAPLGHEGHDERVRRVAGAFTVTSGLVRGCRLVLVDDVMTTGATLASCAVALEEAGAIEVRAAVLARVV